MFLSQEGSWAQEPALWVGPGAEEGARLRSARSGPTARRKHGAHLPVSSAFVSAPGRSWDGQPAGHGNL